MKNNKIKKIRALCAGTLAVSLFMSTAGVPTLAGVTGTCEMDSDCTGIHLVGGKEYVELFTPSNASASNATDGNASEPMEIKYHIHNVNCYNRHEDGNCTYFLSNGSHSPNYCSDFSQGVQCGYEDATEEMLKELTCLTETEIKVIKSKKKTSKISTTISPREDGEEYVFRLLTDRYQKSIHQSKQYGKNGYKEAEVFMLVDHSKTYENNEWTIDGSVFTPGESNYLIAYCCDGATSIDTDAYYRQINLEDATYFSDEKVAEKVRAIVKNAYPFVDADEIRQNLVDAQIMSSKEAEKIDEADLIMASQHAIWRTTNPYNGDLDEDAPYVSDGYHYAVTANRGTSNAYLPTMTAHRPDGSKYFYPALGDRIDKVTTYLMGLDSIAAEESEIIVSTVTVNNLQMIPDDHGSYVADLTVCLNSSGDGDKDNIVINVRNLDTNATESVEVVAGKEEYAIRIPAKLTDKIEVSVSGTQYLEEGVYFFEAEARDLDGDGIATVRESSQNLVGISAGLIPVGDTVILETTSMEVQKLNADGEPLTGAEFTLSFAGESEGELGTYIADENGKLVIDGLMAGVTYELNETKTPEGYHSIRKPIFITVSGDGNLTITVSGMETDVIHDQDKLTIINYDKDDDILIEKIWNDDNHESRPDTVTVQLKKNGNVVETINLSSADEWKFLKTHINGDDDWKVVEVVPEGYISEIKYIDNLIQIVNTLETEPEPSEPEPSEPESGTPEKVDDDDDEPETTVPQTTTPETSAPIPESTTVEPTSPTVIYRGVEIPREILDQYPGRTLDELFDMGVLGEYFENIPTGLLPATNDFSIILMAISILSALGLAGTSMIERKKRK